MRTKTASRVIIAVWFFLVTFAFAAFMYYSFLWGSRLLITMTPAMITYSPIGFTVLSFTIDSLKVLPIFFWYDPPLVVITNPTLYWTLFATICATTIAGSTLIASYAPVDYLIRVKNYEHYRDARKGVSSLIAKGSWKSKIIILYTILSFILFHLLILLTVMGWFQIIHISIIQRSALLICYAIPLSVLFLLHNRFTQTIQKEISTLK
ncbi:MAG: hypothetical protein QXG44_11350 [Candidatus Jordarchaeaceae archaeon]